jgi:hypothetical protein
MGSHGVKIGFHNLTILQTEMRICSFWELQPGLNSEHFNFSAQSRRFLNKLKF